MPAIPSKNTRCRFGVAVRDVTPPVEIYARWWGASPRDLANGVHRPFTATAAVFAPIDGDDAPMALVALDQCSFQNPEDERALRAAIRERAGLDEERLLLNLSHSHSSANTNSLLGSGKPGGEVVPVYLARLADEIGEAVVEAQRSPAPVWITHGTGRCALAANRDFWDAESGRFVCGFNPNIPADDTVMVARVVNDDGTTLATLFNYACHPTTLAWDNELLSPDFIGAAREVLSGRSTRRRSSCKGRSGMSDRATGLSATRRSRIATGGNSATRRRVRSRRSRRRRPSSSTRARFGPVRRSGPGRINRLGMRYDKPPRS